jgi:hypothetical protein
VVLGSKQATPSDPIVIQSFPGEHATIDGAVSDFREVPNDQWLPGPNGEYISADALPHGENDAAQGSFLSRDPYTRLITYSTLEDLQAQNQLFGPIPGDDLLDGPQVSPPDIHSPRRPWVYMGPGLFQDERGFIHIRLSPTTNNLPGFPDYGGESDPRQVPLAIWTSVRAALLISGCTSVYLSDLSVRYGHRTVHIEDSADIRLDHVNVLAGPYGVEFGDSCHGSVMTHCLVDGGMPPWYFRSDRKDGYHYRLNGAELYNGLGENTMKALMFGAGSCTENIISYCEFVNGHDLYMFGTGLEFSRNWINNLNDDALFAETEGITDLKIFENVVEQALSAVNFARKTAGNGVLVYRNLIDLRRPTASVRPQPHDGLPPLQLGHLFKGTYPDGPLDLFHNTIVVKDQIEASSFAHFRSYAGDSPRRSFNNIFVAIDGVPQANQPISYIPAPTWPAATDGNCYFRAGPFADGALFHQPAYPFPASNPTETVPGRNFQSLDELRGVAGDPLHPPSRVFGDSKNLHPPGFEASSIAADPRFRRFDPASPGPSGDDDFRLRSDSPARQQGVTLPDGLRCFDNAPPDERSDIGCFRQGDPPLSVGVDARQQFPHP